MSGFDVDAAAKAHHDHSMGHDLPLAERRDRFRRFAVEHDLAEARAALTRAEDEAARMRRHVSALVEERTALYAALLGDVTFTDATERIDRALADPDMAAKVAAVRKEMSGGTP